MEFARRKYKENKPLQEIVKLIADICLIICVGFTLIYFSCERITVVGNAMNPTLANEEVVLINKMKYAFASPKRYDIIAFENGGINSSHIYIKRIIGLPGETVQIKDKKVYINDIMLTDDVIGDDILTAGLAANPVVLGENEYFVLGDNRNNSEDSRFVNIGNVKIDKIIGSPWLIVNPFSRIGFIKNK